MWASSKCWHYLQSFQRGTIFGSMGHSNLSQLHLKSKKKNIVVCRHRAVLQFHIHINGFSIYFNFRHFLGLFFTVRARTQWEPRHDNASLLSGAQCRPHTHPNRVNAKLPLWSPCGPAEICNLQGYHTINIQNNTKEELSSKSRRLNIFAEQSRFLKKYYYKVN